MDIEKITEAVKLIRKSKYMIAFTGAGVSVESGIPPFRGKGGLWNTNHPNFVEIEYFYKKPLQSWKKIKEAHPGSSRGRSCGYGFSLFFRGWAPSGRVS